MADNDIAVVAAAWYLLEKKRKRVLAPALFCVAIDWILNHMDANPGIRVQLVILYRSRVC